MAKRSKPRSGRTVEIDPSAAEPKKPTASAAPPEPAVSGATLEQKREAMQRLIDCDKEVRTAKSEHDKQKGRYRNAFKEAKKVNGFTEDQLTWFMKNRTAEPHSIDAEMRGRAEIAEFMGMSSGFQSSFKFGLDQKPAQATNAPTDDLKAADSQGYEAGAFGDRPQSNPYPEGSERNTAWGGGYLRAQAERANQMKPTNGAAAEGHA